MKRTGLILAVLFMSVVCSAETIIVDPNGFADFTTIQEAIDYSWNGDVIEVRPATYNEGVLFNGRAITLTSTDPENPSVVASTVISGQVTFNFGEGPNSVITGFTMIGDRPIEGVAGLSASPTISRNIIIGTTYGILRCGGIICNNIILGQVYSNTNVAIYNNVIASSTSHGILLSGSSKPSTPHIAVIKNNIIANCGTGINCVSGYAISYNSFNCFWGNTNHFDGIATAGTGDMVRDPLFAGGSDYHLKSTAGRWTGAEWVLDSVDSPCIDTGDPSDPVGIELNPNGGRINIGAYGSTVEASKSPSGIVVPVCVNPPSMDTNGDCKIDIRDFAEFASQWLNCGLDPQSACWE